MDKLYTRLATHRAAMIFLVKLLEKTNEGVSPDFCKMLQMYAEGMHDQTPEGFQASEWVKVATDQIIDALESDAPAL
jgi:hypothetical protein